MRFDVPAGNALVFSDSDGRVLEQPLVHRGSRTVEHGSVEDAAQP